MSSSPFEYFGLSCPEGGKFYICAGNETEFVGCCTSNPCKDGKGDCPHEDLRTSSFTADTYDKLPPQTCEDARESKVWYTCKFSTPPFLGCCNSNACSNENETCPQIDLIPAKLSDESKLRSQFLDPSGTGSPEETESPESDGGLSTGAVAGIAVGAAVVGLLIVGALLWKFCWVPRKKQQDTVRNVHAPGMQPAWMAGHGHSMEQQQHSPYPESYQSPVVGQHYPSGISSPDLYQKHSPQMSQFERPLSVSTWSDTSAPAYNRHISHQYQQMAPLQELDGTAQVVSELGTGDEERRK